LPKIGMYVTADADATPHRSGVGPAANCTATVSTVDVIMAVDISLGTSATLHALVTNYNCNTKDATNPATGCPIHIATNVSLAFANLPKGAVAAKNATFRLIDSSHGWGYTGFVANGKPLYPTVDQIAVEMKASEVISQSLPIVNANGVLSVALPDLEPYASVHVTVNLAL
jgi:hypothetical protein